MSIYYFINSHTGEKPIIIIDGAGSVTQLLHDAPLPFGRGDALDLFEYLAEGVYAGEPYFVGNLRAVHFRVDQKTLCFLDSQILQICAGRQAHKLFKLAAEIPDR